MEAYNAALALAPDLSDVRCHLGDLWRAQGEGGRAAALACYSEVLRRDPGHAPAWRGLGDVRREAGEPAQAVACYQVRCGGCMVRGRSSHRRAAKPEASAAHAGPLASQPRLLAPSPC